MSGSLIADIDADLLRHHREVQEIHARLSEQGYTGTELRRLVSHWGARQIARRPSGIESEDLRVPTSSHEVPVRLYHPRVSDAQRGLMMYFHGGGWVTGSVETHDSLCAHIAARTGYTVASVDYRLAPEHPFPAANDDALAATMWLLAQRQRYDIPVHGGWAMGGDSAGAHIVLSVTQQMLERGIPGCDRQLLFYPPVAPGLDTGSWKRYGLGPGLTAEAMNGFWQAYAGKGVNPLGLALLDLRGGPRLKDLPPTVLVTAEHDILRDEGEVFASMLSGEGITLRHYRASGMIHGFARMLTASKSAAAHVSAACESLIALDAFNGANSQPSD